MLHLGVHGLKAFGGRLEDAVAQPVDAGVEHRQRPAQVVRDLGGHLAAQMRILVFRGDIGDEVPSRL